jgi:hypothetical protein
LFTGYLFLYISQIPHKNFPDSRIFSFLSKALRKERHFMFSKSGVLWKQTPISRALLRISFGVLSKGDLPPVSPNRAPSERDTHTGESELERV